MAQRDLLLLHVAADFDDLVLPLWRELSALGVTLMDHADIGDDPGVLLPERLAELLERSNYVAVLVSRRLGLTRWPELKRNDEQRLLDHVVMVCHRVPIGALRQMSALEFETVDTSWGLARVAQHLTSILKVDPRTGFHRDEPSRQRATAFWRAIESYVRLELGILPETQLDDQAPTGRDWADALERQIGITGEWVRSARETLEFLDDEEAVTAIVHSLKKNVSGWVPPTAGIESIITRVPGLARGELPRAADSTAHTNAEGEPQGGALPEIRPDDGVGAPSNLHQRSVRVFVSSTFRDMHAERDLLARFVFPQLRQRCLERGVDLGEVDLRWGVTEDEVNTGELLPRCLAEIDRCRPYFLALLGERYGWVPEYIEADTLSQWPFLREAAGRSLTDLEITYALLDQSRSPRALFFLREPSYVEFVAPAERQHFRAENSDAEARTRDLRSRIHDRGFPINRYSTPQVFAYQALEQLWQLLQDDLPPRSQGSGVTEAETRSQELYIRTLAERAIERPRYYAAIDSHLASSSAPLVLVGEPGIGKSVLLAHWVLRRRETHPSDIVISHSAEGSSASSHAQFSSARLLAELKRRLHGDPTSAGSSLIDEQVRHLVQQWQAKSGRQDVPILVFDSADRFRVGFDAREAWWPPDFFSPMCRVIASAAHQPPPDPSRLAESVVRLDGLDWDERRALASNFMSWYGKRLEESALDVIAGAEQAASPRYLVALLNELLVFGDHETLLDRLRWYLASPTMLELYELILTRMETDYDPDYPGLMRDALCLIWASRRGIAEEDLLSLLATSEEVSSAEWWAPIRVTLNDALSSRFNQLRFANDFIGEAVRRRYLAHDGDAAPFHRRLASFLLVQIDNVTSTFGRLRVNSDPGIEREMIWQLSAGEQWDQLEIFLADPTSLPDLWQDPEDVLTYWRRIEEHSTLRIAQTYEAVLADPSMYRDSPDFFVIVAEILTATGHGDMVQRAVNHLTELSSGGAADSTWIIPLTAELLKALGDWSAALEVLKGQEQGLRESRQYASLERNIHNQGNLLVNLEQFSDALERFREAESICRVHGIDEALVENLFSQITPLLRCGLISPAEARQRMERYTAQQYGI